MTTVAALRVCAGADAAAVSRSDASARHDTVRAELVEALPFSLP
jgi:hypothetical protein